MIRFTVNIFSICIFVPAINYVLCNYTCTCDQLLPYSLKVVVVFLSTDDKYCI